MIKTVLRKNLRQNDKLIFIIILRCLAACLITNTHYNSVYPVEALACGGLLGDALFFAVSGYCLIESKEKNFLKWYGKRLLRIYPAIVIMTLINIAIGYYSMNNVSFIKAFIYPTFYIFVGAIMLLYIPLFFVRNCKTAKQIAYVMIGVLVAYLVTYVFFLDKSTYVMNAVSNPIVLFLYFESMLFGAYAKKKKKQMKVAAVLPWQFLRRCYMAF